MSARRLDTQELHRRLDERRLERGISWRQIARECDISPNALSRLQRGAGPDADSLLTLLWWLDPSSPLAELVVSGDDHA